MYSYLLIQYKSMAQEVLFCMQGCFYLSALSKGFTFILARSCIYLFYFIRLNFPKTSLIPDRRCCMFVLFHLSAVSNNLLQLLHQAGPLLQLPGWQHVIISTHIIFPTIYSDSMHLAGSWSQLCPNRVVETSKQNANGEQYISPTYRVVY